MGIWPSVAIYDFNMAILIGLIDRHIGEAQQCHPHTSCLQCGIVMSVRREGFFLFSTFPSRCHADDLSRVTSRRRKA